MMDAHYLLKLKREELGAFRNYSEHHKITMAELLRSHIRTLVGRRLIKDKAEENGEPRIKTGARR
jgi:hypothetical protein